MLFYRFRVWDGRRTTKIGHLQQALKQLLMTD